MNAGKVVLGVLVGFAVGATAGILFAPDKGSSTRKKISKKSDAYVDELEDKFNTFVDDITEKFETVKTEAVRIAKNGKAKAEEIDAKVAAAVN